MKVNPIIINYNDASNTVKFIEAIINYEVVNKLIVVDNCSSDDSLTILNNYHHDKLIIIPNPINSGYGAGINIGARYIDNHDIDGYLMVCNNDIIINSEEDIKKMLSLFTDKVSVVAPIIEEKGITYYGWRLCNINEEIKMSLPFVYKRYENKYRYYSEPQDTIDCVKGCMFIIDPKDLKAINYFDPDFFLYYEENVLGKKLKNYGGVTKLCRDVTVIHNHSVSIDKSINRINKYKALKKSHQLYCKRYLHASKMQLLILKVINNLFLLGIKIKLLLKKGGN